MLKMLARRISDGAMLRLIRKWLKAGVLEPDGRVLKPESGTPQGGIVSPVLANVYLHYVLDLWFEHRIRKGNRGQSRLFRYADDFVACFDYRHEAAAFETLIVFAQAAGEHVTPAHQVGSPAAAASSWRPAALKASARTSRCSLACGSIVSTKSGGGNCGAALLAHSAIFRPGAA